MKKIIFFQLFGSMALRWALAIFLCTMVLSVKAQITFNTSATPTQLAQSIIGPGFTIQNTKLNCPALAIGTFTNVSSNIGLSNGIILTSGKASMAVGPNNLKSAGFNHGVPGDMELDIIAKATTYDGCVLEMDLLPSCDTLKIEYVFGSEEYPEYIGSEFNDVFAFLISGPGIPGGTQNIAVVPGTNKIVSVNNINPGANASYFVDNKGTSIQYDGFTKPLVAKAVVRPCERYHLKIAIADVTDGIFDSGVFIKGKSVQCTNFITTYTAPATSTDAVKGCLPGTFTFCRDGDSSASYTVNYTILGTAVGGVDYKPIAASVVIPAGKKCATFNLETFTTPGTIRKEVSLAYQRGPCPVNDTVRLMINNSLPFNAGPDVRLCSGDTVTIGIPALAGFTYTWSPGTGLSDSTSSSPTFTATNSGGAPIAKKYVLSVSKSGECVKSDTILVSTRPLPVVDFSPSGVCRATPSNFKNLTTAPEGSYVVQYLWNFGSNMIDTAKNPSPSFFVNAGFDVTLTATDNYNCVGLLTKPLEIYPTPEINFSAENACLGTPVKFIDSSRAPGGSITEFLWKFGDSKSQITASPGINHNYTAAGMYNVELIATTDKNCSDSLSKNVVVSVKPSISYQLPNVCQSEPAKFANTSIGDYWKWKFGDGDSSTLRSPFHTYDKAGTYTVELIGSNKYGCFETIQKTLLVNPKPNVEYIADTVAGCAPLCINFLAQTADTLKSWEWTFASGSKFGANTKYCYETAGSFSPTLIATSNKGCVTTVVKKNLITVYPDPKAGFVLSSEIKNDLSNEIKLTNIASNAQKIMWDFGDGKTSSSQLPKVVHSYDHSGVYIIKQYAYNEHGCVDISEQRVEVSDASSVYIPNTITPNLDSHNERFGPVVEGAIRNFDFEMTIFNRWGDKIFTSLSLYDMWDGTLNGEIVENDVYVYRIIFKQKGFDGDIKTYSGNVNVIK